LFDELFTADIPRVALWVSVRQCVCVGGCTGSFKKHFNHIVVNGSILHPTGSFDEKKKLQSDFGRLDKDWISSKETKQSTVEEKQEEEVGEEKELTNPSKTAKQHALNTLWKRTKIGVCDTTSPTAASYSSIIASRSPSHSWAGNLFRLVILVLIVLAPVATAVDI
jgi:hypothetical protein